MSINALNEKIEKQLEKLNQLKAQKQAIEAREKKKISEQQRKEETRKKILIGSMMLKKMEDEAEKIKILAELNEYLTEDRDRKLFNMLPVKDENETNNLTSNL
jgi:adenine C2-methylase RlmN of 23S rRNA A2503 and tRNA A37